MPSQRDKLGGPLTELTSSIAHAQPHRCHPKSRPHNPKGDCHDGILAPARLGHFGIGEPSAVRGSGPADGDDGIANSISDYSLHVNTTHGRVLTVGESKIHRSTDEKMRLTSLVANGHRHVERLKELISLSQSFVDQVDQTS